MSFYIYETFAEKKGDVEMGETDVERLRRLLERWKSHGILYQDDGDWLFEQVKQVEELRLRPKLKWYLDALNDMIRTEKENIRLRDALGFYANRINYELNNGENDWLPTVPIDKDGGEKARQALAGDAND